MPPLDGYGRRCLLALERVNGRGQGTVLVQHFCRILLGDVPRDSRGDIDPLSTRHVRVGEMGRDALSLSWQSGQGKGGTTVRGKWELRGEEKK